jgi:hypothetical protein
MKIKKRFDSGTLEFPNIVAIVDLDDIEQMLKKPNWRSKK